MLGFKLKSQGTPIFSCCLGEKTYSFSAVQDNYKLRFCERREFTERNESFIKAFAESVEHLNLIGKSCKIILAPGQYQLLLMDALDMPEDEMAKAIRWRLKGLVEYPLNDLAVDVCLVPPHGVVGQRKKVFVAVTSLAALKTKLDLFETAYLKVSAVEIAELALRNAISFIQQNQSTPVIVISLEENICQLQVIYNNNLYLIRELSLAQEAANSNSPQSHTILLEIQRSIDYCLSELKLPEPHKIIFTPSFYEAEELLTFLRKELSKEIILFDFANYLEMEPALSMQEQKECFYSIGGAITLREMEDEQANDSAN